MVQYKF